MPPRGAASLIGDAHAHAVRERAQLLEPLDALERMRRAARPTARARRACRRTRRRAAARAHRARRRPRRRAGTESARAKNTARAPSSAATTFTTSGRAQHVGCARARRRCRAGSARSATCASAPRTAAAATNGSSPCTLTIASKPRQSARARDLGDAIGPARVRAVGEDGLAAGASHARRRSRRCRWRRRSGRRRGATTTRSQTRTMSGTPARRRSGFRGRRVRAQSGWDDGERLHERLAGPRRCDAHAERAPDATFTPVKIRRRRARSASRAPRRTLPASDRDARRRS